MSNEVVVEVEVCECCREGGETFDFRYGILAQAETCYGPESLEAEGGNGGDASMDAVDFGGVGRVVVEEICGGGVLVSL